LLTAGDNHHPSPTAGISIWFYAFALPVGLTVGGSHTDTEPAPSRLRLLLAKALCPRPYLRVGRAAVRVLRGL